MVPELEVVRIGYRQGEPAVILTQFPPGALIAISDPTEAKPTLVPTWRKPPTAMTPGQLAGVPTKLPAELPAETTITVPAAVIWLTTSI